jgi:hypothetical protein
MKKPEAKIIRNANPNRANRYLLTGLRDLGRFYERVYVSQATGYLKIRVQKISKRKVAV